MKRISAVSGFGFTGYRSFWSPDPQRIGPLGSVHLIVGANNVGKSNILRFASQHLPALRDGNPFADFSEVDRPKTSTSVEPAVSIGLTTDKASLLELAPGLAEKEDQQRTFDSLRHLLQQPAFRQEGNDLSWIDYVSKGDGYPRLDLEQLERATDTYLRDFEKDQAGKGSFYDRGSILSLRGILTAIQRRPHSNEDNAFIDMQRIFQSLEILKRIPDVEFIESSRRVKAGEDGNSSHSGLGLIKKLAALQNPVDHDPELLKKFCAINEFVRIVTENPQAQILIPHTQDVILFKSHGRVLPLESLGDGIHQVIILAAAATVIEKKLVCIEEPEVHLHPLLQRRLLAYLAGSATTNQYLVATHSAHILDQTNASISHVTLEESGTLVQPAVKPHQLSRISAELGYRASDIVQANCVIWVEGPSDRIYISHWLRCLDSDLVEGIHYVIMFYGGSVLNHLSTDDPESDVEEFISLRRLNRNMVVVMDSDKEKYSDSLGESKKKIASALLEDPHGHSWITQGYTIENYVPPSLLGKAVKEAHKNAESIWTGVLYVNPLRDDQHTGTPIRLRKALVANAVVSNWSQTTPWLHGLREQVEKLVEFIRKANDLPNTHAQPST
jgi:AAA domain, putative AbiEii toxin, Type IV TA system